MFGARISRRKQTRLRLGKAVEVGAAGQKINEGAGGVPIIGSLTMAAADVAGAGIEHLVLGVACSLFERRAGDSVFPPDLPRRPKLYWFGRVREAALRKIPERSLEDIRITRASAREIG